MNSNIVRINALLPGITSEHAKNDDGIDAEHKREGHFIEVKRGIN